MSGALVTLQSLETPRLVLDGKRLDANLARMRDRMLHLGVPLRPHVKTAKCPEVIDRALSGLKGPITVSTLKEAEQFFAHGYRDILYAVGIAPSRLDHVADLRRRGADISVILDSVDAARAVNAAGLRLGVRFPALVEVDCDGHRSGIEPGDDVLLAIARELSDGVGGQMRGVMTHAGGSYNSRSINAIMHAAEKEREAVVTSRNMLVSSGLPCPVVSVGSTPTAMYARNANGVTEVRAGVYMFFDLVMAGLGVCAVDDIALSILTTVIGHQSGRQWLITDAGWMSMSRDRGTSKQSLDQGYGLACDIAGNPIEDLIVADANQEHGIIARRGGGALDLARFPIGSRLRILPNHACATAAQHHDYAVISGMTGRVDAIWSRFSGW